jgi:hypothetical protein
MKLLSMQFLQPPTISHLFVSYTLLSAPFSHTFSLCSSPNVRCKVSHPYKTKRKIIGMYILILTLIADEKTKGTELHGSKPTVTELCITGITSPQLRDTTRRIFSHYCRSSELLFCGCWTQQTMECLGLGRVGVGGRFNKGNGHLSKQE